MKANIKVIQFRYLLMILLAGFISACSGQGGLATIQPMLSGTASIAPAKDTLTSEPATQPPTLTPVAVHTPLINATTPPPANTSEPDLLLGTGAEDYSPYSCLHKGAIGEVWLSKYPYDKASPLLADPKEGFYNPTWSPDGKWVAFGSLAWEVEPTEIARDETGITNRYENSLQVSVIRPDGSNRRAISREFSRDEYLPVSMNCDVMSFISFKGWSPDSQWLAYMYIPGGKESNTLFLSNVETGEQHELLLPDVWDITWAHSSNQFAVIDDALGQIKVYSVENLESPQILESPSGLPDDLQMGGLAWGPEDKTLNVTGRRKTTPLVSYMAWKIDIATGEWIPIDENEARMNVGQSPYGFSVYCSYDTRRIEFFDDKSGEMIGEVMLPDDLSCDSSNWFLDRQGQPGISFVFDDGRSILKIVIADSALLTETLTFPEEITRDYAEIISQNWGP